MSWEAYHEQVAEYGTTAGVPVDGPTFVGHVRDWLAGIAQATDEALPTNKLVRIENGEPIIMHPPRKTESSSVRDLEARLAEHMPEEHILDLLATEHWLHWTSPFGPISGHETKLEDAVVRILVDGVLLRRQYGLEPGGTLARWVGSASDRVDQSAPPNRGWTGRRHHRCGQWIQPFPHDSSLGVRQARLGRRDQMGLVRTEPAF